MLSVGDDAPDFSLPGTDGSSVETYRLADAAAETPVVLFFYPFDFHPQCTEDLCTLRDFEWVSEPPSVRVFGVGTDSAYSHRAYHREQSLSFALLSDDDGAVAERYGVLAPAMDGHRRVPRRALFLVDADLTVRFSWAAGGPGDEPPLDRLLDALAELDAWL